MEFVRVRDRDTGHHLSIPRARLERTPEAYTELKQDATYSDGTPLPPKHKTTVSAETGKSGKAPADNGQSADTSKEN